MVNKRNTKIHLKTRQHKILLKSLLSGHQPLRKSLPEDKHLCKNVTSSEQKILVIEKNNSPEYRST